jgi:hypothetical protein
VVSLLVLGGGLYTLLSNTGSDPSPEIPVVTAGASTVTVSLPDTDPLDVDYVSACATLLTALNAAQTLSSDTPAAPPPTLEGTNPDLDAQLGDALSEPVTALFNDFSVTVSSGAAFDAAVTVRDNARLDAVSVTTLTNWALKNCGPDVTGDTAPVADGAPDVFPAPPVTAAAPPGVVPDTRVGPAVGEPIPGATEPGTRTAENDGPPPPPVADPFR